MKRWSEEGVWDKIFDYLKDDFYQKRQLSSGVVAVDSSFVEANIKDISGNSSIPHLLGKAEGENVKPAQLIVFDVVIIFKII